MRDNRRERERLVELGLLVPGHGLYLVPFRLPPGTPVVRIDAKGRQAAERAIARRDGTIENPELGETRARPRR